MTTTKYLIAKYFGFFNGVPKDHYAQIVSTAPFDRCDVLILAFVHAVERDGVYAAEFTNWRDNKYGPPDAGDARLDPVELVVKGACKEPRYQDPVVAGVGNERCRQRRRNTDRVRRQRGIARPDLFARRVRHRLRVDRYHCRGNAHAR